jgi:hypothetical protein
VTDVEGTEVVEDAEAADAGEDDATEAQAEGAAPEAE